MSHLPGPELYLLFYLYSGSFHSSFLVSSTYSSTSQHQLIKITKFCICFSHIEPMVQDYLNFFSPWWGQHLWNISICQGTESGCLSLHDPQPTRIVNLTGELNMATVTFNCVRKALLSVDPNGCVYSALSSTVLTCSKPFPILGFHWWALSFAGSVTLIIRLSVSRQCNQWHF